MRREGRLSTWSPFEFSRARWFGMECLGKALICCHNSFFPFSLWKSPIGKLVVQLWGGGWQLWKDSSGSQSAAAAGALAKLTNLDAPPSEAVALSSQLDSVRGPWVPEGLSRAETWLLLLASTLLDSQRRTSPWPLGLIFLSVKTVPQGHHCLGL